MNLVGTARCAVRAAFSGATVPPATARAGTSQRDVPTRVRFKGRGACRRPWLGPLRGVKFTQNACYFSAMTTNELKNTVFCGGYNGGTHAANFAGNRVDTK